MNTAKTADRFRTFASHNRVYQWLKANGYRFVDGATDPANPSFNVEIWATPDRSETCDVRKQFCGAWEVTIHS